MNEDESEKISDKPTRAHFSTTEPIITCVPSVLYAMKNERCAELEVLGTNPVQEHTIL
jgi:hypothetical protein